MTTDPCVIIGMLLAGIVCLWVAGQSWGARW